MFEGKPPSASEASKSATGANAGEQLHTLSWSDLVAKLEAARDLRVALANGRKQEKRVDEGSFDPKGAHHLAEHQEHFPRNNELSVNPLDSGNRKETGGIESLSKTVSTGSSEDAHD